MPANPKRSPEQFRVAGSGLTVFSFGGQPIAFSQSISEVSPQPVAAPEAIQPMDAAYPMEILVPQAIGPGTLEVRLFERYTTKVWDQLMSNVDSAASDGELDTGFNRKNPNQQYQDLKEVFNRMANIRNGVSAQRRVYAPDRIGQKQWYADVYKGVRITDIRDDEDINIGTMSVVKSVTMMYTHKKRTSLNG